MRTAIGEVLRTRLETLSGVALSAKNWANLLPRSPIAKPDVGVCTDVAIAANAIPNATIADAERAPSLAWAKLELRTVGPGGNLATRTVMALAINVFH